MLAFEHSQLMKKKAYNGPCMLLINVAIWYHYKGLHTSLLQEFNMYHEVRCQRSVTFVIYTLHSTIICMNIIKSWRGEGLELPKAHLWVLISSLRKEISGKPHYVYNDYDFCCFASLIISSSGSVVLCVIISMASHS